MEEIAESAKTLLTRIGLLMEGTWTVSAEKEDANSHSYLSATMGSTRSARRAGKYPATSATPMRSPASTPKVGKLTETIPKTNAAIARLTAKEMGKPIAKPTPETVTA